LETIHTQKVALELGIKETQVAAVAGLFEQGATVPFIARYRKEVTGSLDEVVITEVRDRLKQLADLDTRRAAILKSLQQQEVLTEEIEEAVNAAETLAGLEDIYLPYKPKRRTRGMIAKEKGLEPLAIQIFRQEGCDPVEIAGAFLDPEKGLESIEDALAGARDIIAEWINEDSEVRAALRRLYHTKGTLLSKVAADMETDGAKYRDYFDWQEAASTAPSHRILAMRRGEKEGFLNLSMAPAEEDAVNITENQFVQGDDAASLQIKEAAKDAYRRLLSRAMETELRLATKEQADQEAIRVFAENLKQLLLAPPLGAKRVLAIDPGFRTGCKVVCLDRQGKLLHNDTVYLHLSEAQNQKGAKKITELCQQYNIEAIAVGNGTAGRETETFVKGLALPNGIQIVLVNESGASIYSASEVARKEFPNHDVTVRGSVSIGRRLMDPLSELVKIDPKSIGVGQYQHDVDQSALRQSLDDVVISCVNSVGVDANRASAPLLTYVSGLGPQLAQNIVSYRDEHGPFESRKALKEVPRLGPKAFEQCAGFLRVLDGAHPLDASAVHPESYHVVDAMANDLGCQIKDLVSNSELHGKIDLSRYATETIGLPTLTDIVKELAKPGRDPRDTFEVFEFAKDIETMADLTAGMKLPGVVTNVTAFGAFVDIGVHQDGLVHISELADRFVKDPAKIVQIQQKVKVTVLDVDIKRKRISLSMRSQPKDQPQQKKPIKKKASVSKAASKKPSRSKEPFNNPFAALLNKEYK
jgi:protein Tex